MGRLVQQVGPLLSVTGEPVVTPKPGILESTAPGSWGAPGPTPTGLLMPALGA